MDGFSKELAENPKQTAVEGEDMLKVRGDIIGYVSLGGWEGAHNIILGWGTYPTLVEMYRKKLYPFPMTLLILSIYVLLGLLSSQLMPSEISVCSNLWKQLFLNKSDYRKTWVIFHALFFLTKKLENQKLLCQWLWAMLQGEGRLGWTNFFHLPFSSAHSITSWDCDKKENKVSKLYKKNLLVLFFVCFFAFPKCLWNDGQFFHLPKFLNVEITLQQRMSLCVNIH